MAAAADEWAGIPMPLEGESLVIEKSYRFAPVFNPPEEKDEPKPGSARERNSFWSWKYRSDVVIWEEGGKICWGPTQTSHSLPMALRTLGCSAAWGLEQEQRALQLLGTMIRHHQLKQYILTGMFLETSARSGVMYLFRRLRPTVALSVRNNNTKILAALCMHPIGYYNGSWAGSLCPTDDVIAHLALMRGDEHLYWRRCNQHAAYRHEAGL
jgi:hypothetical protein